MVRSRWLLVNCNYFAFPTPQLTFRNPTQLIVQSSTEPGIGCHRSHYHCAKMFHDSFTETSIIHEGTLTMEAAPKFSSTEHTSLYFDIHVPLGLSANTFNLENAVCSHGLFMMAPNKWDPTSKSLLRPLRLSLDDDDRHGQSVLVRVSQPSNIMPHSLIVRVYDALSLTPPEQEAVVAQVRRMLRLSESEESKIREFQDMHGEAKKKGFGRVFRSPTLFEDMVKCILFCNCQWPRTLSMAEALCELQLELQQHSSALPKSEADDANSKTITIKTEHFAPKTPAGKETKKRRKVYKSSKALFREYAGVTEVLESELVSESCVEMANHSQLLGKPASNIISSTSIDKSLVPDIALDEKCKESKSERSCNKLGNFPSPNEIAKLDERYLKERCKLGYRAGRILRLAQDVVEGKIQLRLIEELCTDTTSRCGDVEEKLKEIYGFGPFTCKNVLMCLGFYNIIPADSETIRHLKQIHAKATTTQTVQEAVDEIFLKFEPFQFLAYWLEVWNFYEERFGKASEMLSSNYKLITANNMRVKGKLKRSTPNCI